MPLGAVPSGSRRESIQDPCQHTARKLGGRPTGFRRAPLVSRQPACKPGSGWYAGETPHTRRPFLWDAGYPAPPATYPDGKIWTQIPKQASHRPYSVLLPVGFAVPPALPPARCALTAPFHPYRGKTLRTAAVCSLWHCPWVRTRRMLSGTACPRSPDFPPRQPFGFAGAAVQPTDAQRDGRSALRRQGLGQNGPAHG